MTSSFSIEHIMTAITEVAIELGAIKAILFGSMANGTQSKKSDVDIIFIQNTSLRFLDRLDKPLSLLYDKIKGRSIDVLVYTPEEYAKMILDGNKFMSRISNSGKVVYEL